MNMRYHNQCFERSFHQMPLRNEVVRPFWQGYLRQECKDGKKVSNLHPSKLEQPESYSLESHLD